MTTNPRFARPLWHLVDARGQVVGRLATQLSQIIRGKHKPTFQPNADCGDYVVVINASQVKFTGKKETDKKYVWHTGWVGGLKTRTVQEQLQRKPEEVIRKAVMGMMKKNNMREIVSKKLRIFPGDKHLHEDVLPPGTPPVNL